MMKHTLSATLLCALLLTSQLALASSFQLNGTGYLWTKSCQNCNGNWKEVAQPSNFLATLSLKNNQWTLTSAITGLGNREYTLDLSVSENITYVHMTRGIDRCAVSTTQTSLDINGECGSWVNSIGMLTSLFPIGLNGYIELSGTSNPNANYWAFIGSFSLIEIQ